MDIMNIHVHRCNDKLNNGRYVLQRAAGDVSPGVAAKF